MIFVKLIALFGIAAGDFDYHGRPTYQDVIKFYRTNEIIYLLKRSYIVKINGDHPTCVYNKVKSTNYFEYKLEQGYTTGGQHVKYDVKATCSVESRTDMAPVLSMRKDANKSVARNYNFHFHDPVAHCAVITFTDYSGTLRCELHTWKDYASYVYYENCQEEYDYQCPGREGHSVYLRHCPHIE